ncbi:MAG TPA: xylulokinase [Anaerolineaceae bacterium]|nr:xylulokinase [Anaerolineaceae bacterium]
MPNCLLGIDIGTSGLKSLLVDEQGKILFSAYREYDLSSPHPGWYEQDPEDWWRAAVEAVQELLFRAGGGLDILAVGLSGQMHGMVGLDVNGKVVRPCMIWADLRNSAECEQVYEQVGGLEELLRLTNNRMLTGYTGGKVLWVRNHEPHVYGQMVTILNPKDYIRYRLTGVRATDVSDASGTGLFDVRKRAWSKTLLKALDLPERLFPHAFESCEVSGMISDEVSRIIGLKAGIPVMGGGGDAVIQTTGTGLVKEGVFATTIGTGGIVSTALDHPYDNPEGRLQVFCNNMPDKWHSMGVTLSAGGALRWYRDAFAAQEKEIARLTGHDVYDLLMAEAAASPAGSEGLLFLPHLLGARCPEPDPNARGAYVGLTIRHDRRHLLRALVEGITFSLKDMTCLYEKMGVLPDELRTSGGGSRSPFWRQIQADVFNRTIHTMYAAAEGGAYGAALAAGVGAGVWPDMEAAAGCIPVETTEAPDPSVVPVYEKLFQLYQRLHHALQETFDGLADMD